MNAGSMRTGRTLCPATHLFCVTDLAPIDVKSIYSELVLQLVDVAEKNTKDKKYLNDPNSPAFRKGWVGNS